MPQRKKSQHRPKEDWSNAHLGASEHSALEYGQAEQGQPLEPGVRAITEPQFGHDFAKIRIFASDLAAHAADTLQARAFNVGNDLVFNQGEYRPETREGQMVLAHELAHAVQHDRFAAPSSKLAPRSSPNDAAETEAHAAAASVMAGGNAQILTPPTAMFSKLPQNDSSLGQGAGVEALSALDHTIGAVPSSNTSQSPNAASTQGGLATGQTFKFSLGKNSYNLDTQAAVAKLKSYREMLKSDVVDDKRIHREVRDHREAHSIVGFWADTLGGADLPNYERWDSIKDNLFAAKLAIEHVPLDELHLRQAEMWMRLTEMTSDSLMREIGVYSRDTVKGAERAATGLEAVRDTSKMAVDAMSGGKLGAAYGGIQQVAQQGSEVAYGQREGIDFKGIAVNTTVDYLSGKITGKLGAGSAVGKRFGSTGVKSIAGKVVGEVVDQKVGAAVGIGTNAAVANIAGLENAPSLEETGASLWHSATEFNPGEMAKSYAMGKVMKGAVESHNSAQTTKTPAIPHPVTEQPSAAPALEKPVLEPQAQQPATAGTPKAASQLPAEQIQMLLVAVQAASAHTKQANAKLETHTAKTAHSESALEGNSVEANYQTNAASPKAPALESTTPTRDEPATNTSHAPETLPISAPSGNEVHQANVLDPNLPANSTPSENKAASSSVPENQPSSKTARHPFDDEPTVVTGRNDQGTRRYTTYEMRRMRILQRKFGLEAAADEVHAKFGDKLKNFSRLSTDERYAIMDFAVQTLNRHFTADHEFAGRAEAPDMTFKDGANVSWLGETRGQDNAIALNNTTPYNRRLTGSEDAGLAGTLGHEFSHIMQHSLANNPEGSVDPGFGHFASEELRNVFQPGTTQDERNRYHRQPLEHDARRWGREFNQALGRSGQKPSDAQTPPELEFSEGSTQKIPVVTAADLDGKTQASVKREPPTASTLSHDELFGDLAALEHSGASPLEPRNFANPHSSEPSSPQIPEGSGTSLPPGKTEQIEQTASAINAAPAASVAPAINAASAASAAPSAASPSPRMSAEGRSMYKSFREDGMSDAEARKFVQELEESAAAMPEPGPSPNVQGFIRREFKKH